MNQNRRQILYVGPPDETARIVSERLQSAGYQVCSLNERAAAPDLVRARYFDLYILSEEHSDENGLWLCRELSSIDPRTPILVCCNDTGGEKLRRFFQAGARWCLRNPPDPWHLLSAAIRLICLAETRPEG